MDDQQVEIHGVDLLPWPFLVGPDEAGQVVQSPLDAAALGRFVMPEVDAKSAALNDLSGKEFAGVPLTKADAQSARNRLWDWHKAFVRNERSAEIKDKILKEDKLEMKNRINDPAAQGALRQAKVEFEKVRKASGTGELQKKN